jgi:hypothetical protein
VGVSGTTGLIAGVVDIGSVTAARSLTVGGTGSLVVSDANDCGSGVTYDSRAMCESADT